MKSPVATREGGAAGQGGSEESEDPERTAVEVAARVLSILTPNHDAAAPALCSVPDMASGLCS